MGINPSLMHYTQKGLVFNRAALEVSSKASSAGKTDIP